jgi:cytochrome c
MPARLRRSTAPVCDLKPFMAREFVGSKKVQWLDAGQCVCLLPMQSHAVMDVSCVRARLKDTGVSMKTSSMIMVLSLVAAPFPALADGDPVAGAKAFKACQACHVATEAKNKVGPHLVGIVGRPIASVADFKYSPAMIEYGQGKVWDDATLAAYLKAPKAVVKGTKMAYAGVKKDEDLANIIAYMKDPAAGGQ